MTREIPLTRGMVALVDARDHAALSRFKWCAWTPDGLTFYAVRNGRVAEGRSRIYMHREIVDATRGQDIDHVNGDGLDNRRANLRACTRQENARNHHNQRRGKTSRFVGVHWRKDHKRWCARVKVGSPGATRQHFLGNFRDEVEAARAYDRGALKHYGAFAATNFPREEYDNADSHL